MHICLTKDHEKKRIHYLTAQFRNHARYITPAFPAAILINFQNEYDIMRMSRKSSVPTIFALS